MILSEAPPFSSLRILNNSSAEQGFFTGDPGAPRSRASGAIMKTAIQTDEILDELASIGIDNQRRRPPRGFRVPSIRHPPAWRRHHVPIVRLEIYTIMSTSR